MELNATRHQSWEAPPFEELVNISHRGASAYAPEHTIAAYDLALSQGAHFLELDVQMTRDGELAIVHDESIRRTSGPSGEPASDLVSSRTLEELRSLDVGSWFNELYSAYGNEHYVGLRILSLEDVLLRYRHCVRFCIELKSDDGSGRVEARLLELLARYGLDRPKKGAWRTLVMSVSGERLRTISELGARLPLIRIFEESASSELIRAELAEVAGCAAVVAPHLAAVDAKLVGTSHEAGLGLCPYTVNEESDMTRLLALGVDGIITDFPDRLDGLLWARARTG
jgi:glycerophosphoryl diester phosphodiesterase